MAHGIRIRASSGGQTVSRFLAVPSADELYPRRLQREEDALAATAAGNIDADAKIAQSLS